MPNFLDKIKNRIDTVKNATEETFKDFVAESKIQEERINICKNCEKFFAPTKQCLQCGCFLIPKTNLKKAQCPLGKW